MPTLRQKLKGKFTIVKKPHKGDYVLYDGYAWEVINSGNGWLTLRRGWWRQHIKTVRASEVF